MNTTQYRLIAIIFSAAIVLQLKVFFVGAAFAAPKPGFNLASKLATIPGRKPRYMIPLGIESYLKNSAVESRWKKDLMPTILSGSDVSRYRVIFRLQREGEWPIVDRIIHSLENSVLMGHVLSQRYLHPNRYRSKYRELKAWMDNYADHPQARRIYKLALKRRPANWKKPKKPVVWVRGIVENNGPRKDYLVYKRYKKLSRLKRREMLGHERRLRYYQRKGWTLAFKNLIKNPRVRGLFHPWQLDRAQARLAAGYFAAGRDQWAIEWANKATRRSGKYLPEAHWTAGLSAWRLGNFRKSIEHFRKVSNSDYASSWLVSAGAFWASRASIKLRRPQDYSKYLEVAAQHPRTFYGIIATNLLDKNLEYDWSPLPLSKEATTELAKEAGGSRTIALLQVGEERLAELELKTVFSTARPNLAEVMMAIADRAEMPSLAMRLANMLVSSGSKLNDRTAYPAPTLKVDNDHAIDRELILAIVRQESRFNAKAKSPRGARGLMQLMPGTASFVARDRRFRGSKLNALFNPNTNIALGQRYINILLKDKLIKGDLFRMVAAWNAGPGKLRKWSHKIKFNHDPLLFVESIPVKETRLFVKRVVTNYWIYCNRFRRPMDSLVALAAGKWPLYRSERPHPPEVAAHGANGKNELGDHE